jgi:hypothetical protein
MGHAVVLGGREPIGVPDKYLIYQKFWEEARKQGALSGACHGGDLAVAVDLPDGLLSLIEVLQFKSAMYQTWYDALNSGFRLTPIAGTDFPCVPVMPGRERVYAQVDGELSHESWLRALKQGRTFVTNGPLLDFRIDGKQIGSDVTLKEPADVSIAGHVRFDGERDVIQRVEIVENGEVIRTLPAPKESAEIRFEFKRPVSEAAWLAVRVWGTRQEKDTPWQREKLSSPVLAHSGAIYINIENKPGLAAHRRAKLLAAKWLNVLEALEKQVNSDDKLAKLGSDGASIKKNRDEFFQRIEAARKYFAERAK